MSRRHSLADRVDELANEANVVLFAKAIVDAYGPLADALVAAHCKYPHADVYTAGELSEIVSKAVRAILKDRI